MNSRENQQLTKKYDKKQGLFREMEAAAKKYYELEQQAYYCTLTGINPSMIIKIPALQINKKMIFKQKREDLYLVNGLYQPKGEGSFERLVLQIVKTIPRPSACPYGIIYNNVLAETSAYNDFKKVMQLLPWQFYRNLTRIYVLRPSFFSKASSWLSFGTISNYLTSKTENYELFSELSRASGVQEEELSKLLPPEVVKELQRSDPSRSAKSNTEKQSKQVQRKRIHVLGIFNQKKQNYLQHEVQLSQKKEKHDILIKSPVRPEKRSIEQYEVGPTGAPIILEMLIYCISNNSEYLKAEGLFRKSVSIDDEIQILQQLNAKNYDFLLRVTDPHLIANAIKRFIAYFREPVIPYDLFDLFMSREGEGSFEEIVMEGVRGLPKSRRMVIFVLFQFMREKVEVYWEFNKMNQKNLCIVLGPCLMYAKVPSFKDLAFSQKIISVVSIIFRKFQDIFGDKKQREALKRSSYRDYKRASIKQKLGITEKYVEELQKEEVEQENMEELKQADNHVKLIKKTTMILHESLDRQSDEEADVIQQQKQHAKGFGKKTELFGNENKDFVVQSEQHIPKLGETQLQIKNSQVTQEKPIPLILPSVPVPAALIPKATQQPLKAQDKNLENKQ